MSLESILKIDANLSNRMRIAEKPGLLRTLSAFLAHSGDSWFWAAGLIILWFSGNAFWKKWALVIFGGIAVLIMMVLIIKFSVKRRRPEGEWGLIYRSTDPHSFPSGHAARSFLIGTLAIELGPPWLALILVIWAPLVALARVAMGVHYVSDILAGALLGVLVGLIGLVLYEPLLAWVGSLAGIPLW
jgi:undecaprenyl-diphosphatase